MNRLHSIQALRGVAAWLVVFHHYNQIFFSWDMSNSIFGKTVGDFFYLYGKLGVDIFFIISGFAMCMTISCFKEYSASEALNFLIKRIVRVAPPYWFYTVILLLLTILLPSITFTQWNISSLLRSFLFLNHENPAPGLGMLPFLTVGWTLNFEMWYYFLCAITVVLFRRHYIIPIILIMFFTPYIWPVAWPLDSFFSSLYLQEFAVGMGIGYCYISIVKIRMHSTFNYYNDSVGIVFGFLVTILSISMFYYFGAEYKLILISMLIIGFINMEAFIGRIFFLLRLGDISYSTYLIHVLIFVIFKNTFDEYHKFEVFIFPIMMILIFQMSVFSFKYIEVKEKISFFRF
ncbi:acyltransferase family protein [Vibrio cholerae]|uniref:acyltransferase family protein n=1 Tax=Vibrio cholerae TaxID=666 RepID=UPI0011D9CBA0|nr:acyltransferase [Vibrio cholerae]TXY51712.1 acyltransferase [Vibrio cholerae]BCN16618.1 hypothetical protein [Vibrio cholerae]GHW53736.1 membrane protein [Vibrio cholerae]